MESRGVEQASHRKRDTDWERLSGYHGETQKAAEQVKAILAAIRPAAQAKNREMMPLTKAQSIFGFTSRKALACFLDRHPEVGQDKPLTKAGTPNQRRRRVDVLALCEAISRTDAIMSDPVRRAKMESRLQKAQLNKELEANALAYLTGKAK